jgi:endonuclease YncB( thermonuclease family)
MNKKTIVLTFLFITSGIFYYQLVSTNERTTVFVARVIDGDTIELDSGQKLRLKGINTPEKSIIGYEEAKDFLKKLSENKSLNAEIMGIDKYGRGLSYIFIDNQNINELILEKGLGTLYYYEEDGYYKDLKNAEEIARKNEIGIWKKSPDANCLELLELKETENPKRCSNNEILRIKNSCNKEINLIIKDEATHIYHETIRPFNILTKNFSCIWNDAGDTLFVWDEKGLLMRYSY